MNKSEIERLKFRRQYLLLPESIECPFVHEVIQISDTYYLYAHPDLVITKFEKLNYKIFLLGDMFDYENPDKNNSAILRDLYDDNFESILKKSSKYAGRFVIVFLHEDNPMIFHDTTASRKVFYFKKNEKIWMASQPHLLGKVLNLKPTMDASKLSYYESQDLVRLLNSNICDSTYYDGIFQLMPNHYLDVRLSRAIRYWPTCKMEIHPLNEIAIKCAYMIKGYMKSISIRYDPMLPVTAGKDSRTLLAASRGCSNIYYYLNKELRLKEKSPDINVPKKLLAHLNLSFNILNPYITINDDFKKIYFENNPFASNLFLPFIFNYYKNFSKRVNLPGNTASAGLEYYLKLRKKDIKLDDLLDADQLSSYQFARDQYNKWLNDCKPICEKFNVAVLSLFYWENRLTNGILQTQQDKDIAQEEFSPFNSRLLVLHLLSVKAEYISPPNCLLYKRIMNELWPEVLVQPINPSLRTNILKIFTFMGILNTVYKIKNKFLRN